MSQHTPGPWFHAGNGDIYTVDASTGKTADVACSYLRIDNKCDANARLIAAAPDLLEALQGLHCVCEIALAGKQGQQHDNFETRHGSFVNASSAMESAEAALAKATGEPT